ncbi:MAG TPA: HupE/UreJ family protein [Kofleriaceae bacterium]|nr:HupE/UreJ family protein [Kofleriaceae bacterium]
MLRALMVATMILLGSSTAHAHQTSVKYIDLVLYPMPSGVTGYVHVTVKLAPGDVTEPMGLAADAKPSVADAVRRPEVASYVQHWFEIRDCEPPGVPEAKAIDDGYLEVRWRVGCEKVVPLQLDFARFFALDQRHEAIVRLASPGRKTIQTIVRASEQTVALRAGESPSLLAWVRTGMDHIYDGTDHILFVISLLLVVMLARGADAAWELRGFVRTLRSTAAVITAFTVAHSISLIAASLGWVHLPSAFVEAVIALSILYTAVEDIVKPDVRWRFFLTFGFGLVHGLGFAGTLSELLPPRDVVVPLLCFNVGVEIGQLTIVAVVLPALYLVARGLGAPAYRRYALPVVAGAFALVALQMFVARVT